MRNLKKYKAPEAEITKFECEDIITVSELGTSILDGKPIAGGEHEYVKINGKKWNEIDK